jgi:hypothetical protein
VVEVVVRGGLAAAGELLLDLLDDTHDCGGEGCCLGKVKGLVD